MHFEPTKSGQPLYKGQDAWSQGVPALYGGSTQSVLLTLYHCVYYIVRKVSEQLNMTIVETESDNRLVHDSSIIMHSYYVYVL